LKAAPEEEATISFGEPQRPTELRWAGAAFENCPSPDDLPMPAFLNPAKKAPLKKYVQDYAHIYGKSDSSVKMHKKNKASVPFFYQRRM